MMGSLGPHAAPVGRADAPCGLRQLTGAAGDTSHVDTSTPEDLCLNMHMHPPDLHAKSPILF